MRFEELALRMMKGAIVVMGYFGGKQTIIPPDYLTPCEKKPFPDWIGKRPVVDLGYFFCRKPLINMHGVPASAEPLTRSARLDKRSSDFLGVVPSVSKLLRSNCSSLRECMCWAMVSIS